MRQDEKFAYLVLLPVLFLVGALIYYPGLYTLFQSLWARNLQTSGNDRFVGLENYIFLLSQGEFWEVISRSFAIVLLALPIELLIGLILALILNESFRGRSVIRTLVILPWMLPPIVNGFLWSWLLNGEYGALNGFLYQLGIIKNYQYWMKTPFQQLIWVTVAHIWTRYSFPMLILLAGLQAIPDDIYDAARVDGAGLIARLRYITLPLLLPSFTIALTVEFIAALQIFDIIWTLTSGGTAGTVINPFTKTAMIFNFEMVFRRLDLGHGSALAYLILLISLGPSILFVRNLYERALPKEVR